MAKPPTAYPAGGRVIVQMWATPPEDGHSLEIAEFALTWTQAIALARDLLSAAMEPAIE